MRFFVLISLLENIKKLSTLCAGMKRKYATIGKRVSKNDDKLNYETVKGQWFYLSDKILSNFYMSCSRCLW